MSGLMAGKRGLIMGLANDKSLAWGIAKALHAQGAELAFSYQGEVMEKRVRPLAESLGCDFLIDCDVSSMDNLDAAFSTAARPPRPLLDGHDLMQRLALSPGPQVGTLLDEMLEAQAAGEITTSDEALVFARGWLSRQGA